MMATQFDFTSFYPDLFSIFSHCFYTRMYVHQGWFTFANWFVFTSLLTYIGSDRPGLKYLNRHVVTAIAPKWYDVGLELMDVQDEKEMKVIRAEQSISDDKQRAKKMLEFWLERKADASWNDLLKALKMPSIGLDATALAIERLLMPESVF